MSFATDLEQDFQEDVVKAYLDFRGGPIAETFLDVAHQLAPVDTGALKANITAFSGSPPDSFDRPEDAKSHDRNAGSPAPSSTKAEALRLSRQSKLDTTYGFASAAGYSSYVGGGTGRITARPFWQAAVAAMETVRP